MFPSSYPDRHAGSKEKGRFIIRESKRSERKTAKPGWIGAESNRQFHVKQVRVISFTDTEG